MSKLSKTQVEVLEQATAREAAFKKAVDWLWGFWDGNTLIARPGCDVEALLDAWDDLLAVSIFPSKAGIALLERLAKLEAQVTDLKTDLTLNATMLAQQCDLAREAETKAAALRGELEQAAAREAALLKVLDDIHGNIIFSMPETLDWSAIAETAAEAFKNPSATAAALLKRLEFLEQDTDHQRSVASQVPYYKERLRINTENLHGALQAALTPLEAAADALVQPAWVEEAAALVEKALAVIREELE